LREVKRRGGRQGKMGEGGREGDRERDREEWRDIGREGEGRDAWR
jgi:hypothetical protein